MQFKIRSELERLLQEGVQMGEVEKSPEAWEVQVRQLIDKYLGPKLDTPTNAHSQGYYDFIFAKSHSAKIAILRTVLLFDPQTKTQKTTHDVKQSKGNSEHQIKATRALDKTQITVAIIGAIGVIAAAIIAAWFAK